MKLFASIQILLTSPSPYGSTVDELIEVIRTRDEHEEATDVFCARRADRYEQGDEEPSASSDPSSDLSEPLGPSEPSAPSASQSKQAATVFPTPDMTPDPASELPPDIEYPNLSDHLDSLITTIPQDPLAHALSLLASYDPGNSNLTDIDSRNVIEGRHQRRQNNRLLGFGSSS